MGEKKERELEDRIAALEKLLANHVHDLCINSRVDDLGFWSWDPVMIGMIPSALTPPIFARSAMQAAYGTLEKAREELGRWRTIDPAS